MNDGAKSQEDEHPRTANPCSLLRVYLDHGKLAEACALVLRLLGPVASDHNHFYEARLPEHGEAGWLPYHHIDQLFELCTRAVETGQDPDGTLTRRMHQLETAMQRHFENLIIAESHMDATRDRRHASLW